MTNKIAHKFAMHTLTNTVVIAPSMVMYFLTAVKQLEEDCELPISTYSILPSLYCPQENCYLFDDTGMMTLIKFTFNASDYLLGEGEGND